MHAQSWLQVREVADRRKVLASVARTAQPQRERALRQPALRQRRPHQLLEQPPTSLVARRKKAPPGCSIGDVVTQIVRHSAVVYCLVVRNGQTQLEAITEISRENIALQD